MAFFLALLRHISLRFLTFPHYLAHPAWRPRGAVAPEGRQHPLSGGARKRAQPGQQARHRDAEPGEPGADPGAVAGQHRALSAAGRAQGEVGLWLLGSGLVAADEAEEEEEAYGQEEVPGHVVAGKSLGNAGESWRKTIALRSLLLG